jgi:prolyl oligopeptidase
MSHRDHERRALSSARRCALPVLAVGLFVACAGTGASREAQKPVARAEASATQALPAPARARFDYPAARRTSDADVKHGVTVADPYRWLEADDADASQWMEQQDARARREIEQLEGRKELLARLSTLYDNSLPALRTRREKLEFANEGKAIKLWDAALGERVVFDKSELPDGVRVARFSPSRDGSILAVELSKNGADMRTLRVVDVKTAGKLEELVGFEDAPVVWTRAGFFYAYTPPDAPHAARWAQRDIRYHETGTSQSRDRIVVPASQDKDASTGMNPLALTTDRSRLVVRTFGNWGRATYALVDLGSRAWPVTDLKADHGTVTKVAVVEDALFVLVQREDGTKEIGRIAKGRADQHPDILARTRPELLSMDAYGTTLVLTFAASAGSVASSLVRRELYDKTFKKLGEATTPRGSTDTYYAYPNSPTLIVTREGLGVPQFRFELDPRTGNTRLLVGSKVDFDGAPFVIDKVEATSKDTTKIPITVFRHKDTPLDGSGSIMAYGYGGFKVSAEQIFYPPWMTWVSRPGGVFVSCHIRGGLELGEAWHEDGARRKRQNTIDDFHACLEEVQRRGYGTAAHTMTQGWSHGGMLVAAAAMQRPELQRVVVSLAPLADMIRFPLFGRGGVSEYGDPDDAGDFRALLAFSPYHQVREGAKYPSFFVTAASKDERVHPMHPRKLTAALQHASTGGEVLLKVLWDAGHLGGGKDDANEILVEAMMFALREFGKPL